LEDEFLLAGEIAQRLRISTRTLRRLAKAGKIPPLQGQTPKLRGWPKQMYERWVASGMPDAAAWAAQARYGR
jgi:predicted site-specific integrase-resolvase